MKAKMFQRNNAGYGSSNLRVAIFSDNANIKSTLKASDEPVEIYTTSHWQGNISDYKTVQKFLAKHGIIFTGKRCVTHILSA